MRLLALTFVLLALDTASPSQDVLQPESIPVGSVRVGGKCTRDFHCVKHAFCRVQETCLCEPFYTPGPDMSTCHATSGTNCEASEDCSTMSNAECVQGACKCKDNFILDVTNSSNCIMKPTREGDKCQRNGDCEDAMDRSLCINEKCKCFSDYRYANETGRCVQVRGIYQPCRYNYECYDVRKPDALHCKGGECAYTDKYSGGGSTFAIAISIVVPVLSVILFSD